MNMKQITHIKCIEPFTLFGIHNEGYCYSCCPVWTTTGDVGQLNDRNSIMDLWNGEKMQYIRQAILDDKLAKVCNFKYCPYAIRNEYLDLESMKNDDPHFNHTLDQIMAGRTIMDKPPYILFLANSKLCNLNCVMCNSRHQYPEDDQRLDKKLFTQVIPEILPDISKIFMSGHGEVLLNQYSRKFLQTLDSTRYPFLKIRLLTNGMLFTPKLWETIRHNRYELISVSIDAASKVTYEKIRRNGNWDILRRNLDLIGELRHRGMVEEFNITFVVMKSNYREMKDFVELGLTLGCDKIIFQKIFGEADITENINITRDKHAFVEIAGFLADPIFLNPAVDTTIIDEYRKYSGQRVSVMDRMITKSKEWRQYIPKRRFW